MMRIRRFRISLALAVQSAIGLSPFERCGVYAKMTGLELLDLSVTAGSLYGFGELAERLESAGLAAMDKQFDDDELLRLCVWTPEMWRLHDAETPLIISRTAGAA